MEWGILIGLVLGLLVGTLFPRKHAGTLQIDHSNSMKDTYRFVIDDIDGLSRKKRITLKVDNNAQLAAPIMERNSSD
jgi:hypothetical protein